MNDAIREEATRRSLMHKYHPTHRPLSDGYNLVGLRGEEEFSRIFGGSVDLSSKPNGDKGIDYIIRTIHGNFSVDIKTARKPGNLIVEKGKVVPLTIYVLAGYSDETDSATLLGWQWGKILLVSPTRDFGKGVINHYIPAPRLRNMLDLLDQV